MNDTTKKQPSGVSVLIPCFNEAPTIAACVQSFLDQTRAPEQIIVVDDCSTDNSAAELEVFGDSITVVRTPQNSGNKKRRFYRKGNVSVS